MSDGTLRFDTKLDNEGVQAGMSQLKSIFKVGMAAIVAKQAIDVAKMGVAYNAQMEQYQTSFETMLGSADKASKHVADLKKMAAKTPFEMEDLAKASQTLMSFGDDVNDIQPHLKMLGDISLGNKEKFSSLSLVFGQVKSQGKLMGQDLLQMINAGFNPLKVISEQTGESMSSLKDKMAKGQISFEDVAGAMEYATSKGGMFYNGMEKQSKTLSGMMSTLKDNVKSFVGELTAPIFEHIKDDVMPKLMNGVEWMSHHLPLVKAILAGLASAISVGFAIHKFTAIKNAIMGVGKAIQLLMVSNPILLVAAAVTALVVGMAVFIKSGGKVSDLTKKIEGFANKLKSVIPKAVKALSKALPGIINSIVKMVSDIAPALIDVGITLIISLANGLVSAIPEIAKAIPKLLTSLLGAVIKNMPKIIKAGVSIIKALAKGLITAIPLLIKTLPLLVKAIVLLGAGILKAFIKAIGQLGHIAVKWLAGFIHGLAAGFARVGSAVASHARSIPGKIRSGIGNLFHIGSDLMNGLVNGIKEGFNKVFNAIHSLGKKVKGKLKSIFGIASPSKFTIWIGKMLMDGLEGGIGENIDKVMSNVESGMSEIKKALIIEPIDIDPEGFKIGSFSKGINGGWTNIKPTEVNQTINIYQPVSSPIDTARAIKNQAITLGLAGV